MFYLLHNCDEAPSQYVMNILHYMCRIFVTDVTKGISVGVIVNLYRLCCEYDQMIGVNVGCDFCSLEYIEF